jgi:glucose/arabinose dehydrogenase
MRPAAARVFSLAAAAVLLAACAGSEDPSGTAERSATAETAAPAAPPPAAAEPPPAPAVPRLPRARGIVVPKGFRAEVFARGLDRPTALAYGPRGRLYATEEIGRVVAVRPGSRRPRVLASGFPTPLGLAWKGRTLFVSGQGRLERLRFRDGKVVARRAIVAGLPYGLHQQDNVVVGPDGRLYLGSGSTCNACREHDRRSAAILSVRGDGRGLRVVASGLRNPFGLAFEPGTDRLYATVNGRDDLPTPSSPEPAEMLVRIEPGADYGWPECWPSWRRKRLVGACAGVTRPIAYLEPHSSADGLAFSTGSSFPARYRDGVFVALWGQYASRRYGRRVDFVPLGDDSTSSGAPVRPFARGFEHPLAVAVDPHGALLVADWGRGTIYRIQARGHP